MFIFKQQRKGNLEEIQKRDAGDNLNPKPLHYLMQSPEIEIRPQPPGSDFSLFGELSL